MGMENIRSVIAKATPYFIRRLIPLKVLQHLYFQGVISARLNGKPVVKLVNLGHQIENEIYWRGFDGCHEKKSMQIYAEILQVIKPKIVWDIGANSGTYGILAKALVQEAKIYFFEPIPKAIEMIHENLRINGFNAEVFQLALGDYDGTGEIYFGKGIDFATSVKVNTNLLESGQEADSIEISVIRADTLMKKFSLPMPEFVKLDVETYEFEVLQGFGTTSFENCIFLLEILSDELAQKLEPFFPAIKYDYYNIDDVKSKVRKTAKLEKSDFYNYLICPRQLSHLFSFNTDHS
jgi:FkbM family methyltransferase